ncbi:hypothetical protein [Maridesulfovibrio sp.]|uniref:hypothetical protein n=1 Tax=Maridesulfovibrio sp. TaxID=2795000 RepID=UPI0039F11C82
MFYFARVLILSLLVSVLLISTSFAATINGKNWYNESPGVHTMKVWVIEPEVSIAEVNIKKDPTSSWTWRYADDTKRAVILTGLKTSGMNQVNPDFKFISPDKKFNFSVEWAEISNDNALTGTNFYINKHWKYTKGDISHTPTPIPGAVILFGVGLSFVTFIRRKFSFR